MRVLLAVSLIALVTSCQRSPEQQQADNLRSEARLRGAEIVNHADGEADRLQEQASALENEAQRSGGLTAERLRVRSDAATKEAKIVRKQANMKAEAIKEGTDARIKASESR